MQTVAVIFGGRSAEHDVSIITALASIIRPLELTKKYRVEAVYISKTGAWFWDDKLKDISLFRSGSIQDLMHKTTPASVQFDGGMTLVKASGMAGRKQRRKIDIVFPAMHGTYGEDGALMGLLEMANVPYVGCGLDASVLAMDKVLAKQIAVAHAIPTAAFVSFSKDQLERESDAVIKTITKAIPYPLFVKPAHLGSSIGISRVANVAELRNALEVAAHYDNKIIVEAAISNLIELTLPIMGSADKPQPALLERPLTQADDFFDFDTKYLRGGKKGGAAKTGTKGAQGYSELPAQLSADLYKTAEQTAVAVYTALGCNGLARVDLLVDSKSQLVYFNEVNPMPGSLYAHNWQQAGVSGVQLVEKLLQNGFDRWQDRQKLATSFSTNFLQQF